MPESTPSAQNAARIMDSEIRRLERAGIQSSNAAAIRLRADVLRAWLRNGDPLIAVADFEATMIRTLGDAMATGYLQGRLRARAIARRARKQLSMAQTINSAMDDFGDRLGLGVTDVQRLADYFTTQATSRVVDAGGVIRSKLADAVAEAIRKGETAKSAAGLIRQAMDASGVTPQNPYLAQTLYRTSLQESYAAARWQANEAPEIQEILWGYEYVATLDDRTTDLCLDLDGTRRKLGDPFWQRYSPPNHWNCRSQLIEIFTDEGATQTRLPKVPLPEEGFQVNFGQVFQPPNLVVA
jgi:SPP1 gp7 family putative phage head morphogenesis protein